MDGVRHARRLLFQCRAPILIFRQNIVTGTALTINDSRAVAVLVSYRVLGNDKLPVPGRLGRRWRASTTRRMREANSVRPVEHQDVLVRTEEAVIEWLTESQRRKTFVEHHPGVWRELELSLVLNVQDGALAVMRLRAKLHPALVIAEVNGLVFRRVDIARPEESNVTVRKDMLVRFASEHQIDVVGRDQFESGPALQVKRGRGRLVQFGFTLGNPGERHRGVAWLEGHRPVTS